MPIAYDHIIPWGRSFDEYVSMFSLTEQDLEKKILGCGDGPACFNAGMKSQGKRVTSIDPIYQFSKQELKQRINDVYPVVLEQTRQNQDKFVWENITSIEDLGEKRMASMTLFLEDYDNGKSEGRYINAELPVIQFKDNEFDLALCSHFLFLYSENMDESFHIQSVTELCRVAKEVRIFPIVDLNAVCSPHVDSVCTCMQEIGYRVTIEPTGYRFQKGRNEMMKIIKP